MRVDTGHLPFVPVFAELGLRIVQLTYNTANSVGCGCYESHDGGLTDFGRELVDALNRAGIPRAWSRAPCVVLVSAIRTARSTRPAPSR